jgi:hypothetical protein
MGSSWMGFAPATEGIRRRRRSRRRQMEVNISDWSGGRHARSARVQLGCVWLESGMEWNGSILCFWSEMALINIWLEGRSHPILCLV